LDSSKTIKELKENIYVLDQEDNRLDNDLKILNTNYELKNFLRKDLTLVESGKIRILVQNYITNKNRIELALFENAEN